MTRPSVASRSPFGASAATVLLALLMLAFFWQMSAHSAEPAVAIPAPAVDAPKSDAASETAVFAGGCFWGVQGVFQHVKGVTQATSGYTGGEAATAHYEEVGSSSTGHAESVQVRFDPRQISYGQLLQVYFSVAHDPTQKNRQGPDRGTQYRSTIFAMNATQKNIADAYIAQLDKSGAYARPIVTTIEEGKTFYAAEGYHQDYLTLHPDDGYIVANDLPKVANLQRLFPALYRERPALVSVAVH